MLSSSSFVQAPYAGSKRVALYDLVYLDPMVCRASELAWDTDEATTQAAFAAAFLGLSVASVTDESPADAHFPVVRRGEVEMPCVSDTYAIGDYLAVASNGASSLLNQSVKKAASRSASIGVVTKHYGAATTKVRFRLLSRLSPDDIFAATLD
jgi:hypothetical protein